MDWRDALKNIAPTLPEGEDVKEISSAQDDRSPACSWDKLTVVMERKGRGGKTATIVAGFTCDESRLREIASLLKNRLGTGGSARGGEILIQGDRREDVKKELRALGYRC